MSRSNTGTCRGCGADMVWALTDRGKGIPLDPEPVADGNLIPAGESEDGRMIVRYLRKGEEPEAGVEKRYKTHFATCPESDSFRRDQ